MLHLIYFCLDIVLMALFCVAIGRDLDFLLWFPVLSHVQVFSWEILLVCLLKYPYSCFSFHFCFLVIFVLLMFVLSVLFLVVVISLPLHFLMLSSSCCIKATTLSSMLVRLLPPYFLYTYTQSTSSLGCIIIIMDDDLSAGTVESTDCFSAEG